MSTVDENGNAQEVILDDEAVLNGNTSSAAPDIQGRNWKVFDVNDYVEFVNGGLIPRMSKEYPSQTDVGYHLCGTNPQGGRYGALGEPEVTFLKERGDLIVSLEDEVDVFVGNYKYGSWGIADANGRCVELIPEEQAPPPEAVWCWYQEPGSSTGHYYSRGWVGTRWVYIRGPRRCVYCTPRTWDSDDTPVSTTRMSQINGTDQSSIRGPADMGGGPGSGK